MDPVIWSPLTSTRAPQPTSTTSGGSRKLTTRSPVMTLKLNSPPAKAPLMATAGPSSVGTCVPVTVVPDCASIQVKVRSDETQVPVTLGALGAVGESPQLLRLPAPTRTAITHTARNVEADIAAPHRLG